MLLCGARAEEAYGKALSVAPNNLCRANSAWYYGKVGKMELAIEQYWEALECLPPSRVTNDERGKTWHMSETTTGTLATWYITLHGLKPTPRYSVTECVFTKHDDLIKLAQGAFKNAS